MKNTNVRNFRRLTESSFKKSITSEQFMRNSLIKQFSGTEVERETHTECPFVIETMQDT